jgi:hypothetical protein
VPVDVGSGGGCSNPNELLSHGVLLHGGDATVDLGGYSRLDPDDE